MAIKTRWGAWIQELAYLRPKHIKRYAREAERLGMTCVAFDLLNHVKPPVGFRGSDGSQFKGNNIGRPRGWFMRNLELIAEEFWAERKIRVTCYGYMTPDVRRWFDVARLNGGCQEYDRNDWWTITPYFADGYAKYIAKVEAAVGDAMNHVDAVEPHLLPEVEAKIHAVAAQAWPGALVAGIDERHVNPGDPMIDVRYGAYDGWGGNVRKWHNDYDGERIVRPFAALPAASGTRLEQIHQIKRYFKAGLRDANDLGVERLFVLPTTNWGVATHAESIDPDFDGWPGMPSMMLEPWQDLFRAMQREDARQ